jgi:hypothetical protein
MILLMASSVLFASQNLPFTVALALMVGIGLLEGVATLMGLGLSGVIDNLLPDVDVDLDVDAGVDVDADVNVDAHAAHVDGATGGLSRVLAWLHFGRVPALVLFVLFLLFFGISGLMLQYVLHAVSGFLLPGAIATVPAFFLTIPLIRTFGGAIARLVPKDETTAVSRNSFVGRVAIVGAGPAKVGLPAQAKLKDEHGQTHYVLVEPDEEGEEFPAGTEVILIRQMGARFAAIKNTSPALSPL